MEDSETNGALWHVTTFLNVDLFLQLVVEDRRKHELGEDRFRAVDLLHPEESILSRLI
jgi:hypothetical protein